jgi:hypothetical protein
VDRGLEARILRETALRLSIRDFETKGESANLRASTQKILDATLAATRRRQAAFRRRPPVRRTPYGHAGLDALLERARSDNGNRVAAVTASVDADLRLKTATVAAHHEPTPRTWVEIVCPDPAPLLGAAHEFFGPGGWVEQPGGDPVYVTR